MINPLNWLKYQFYIYRSGRFFNKKDYPEAHRMADKAVQIYPKGFYGFQNRGYANAMLNNLDETIVDLSQALEIKKTVYALGLRAATYHKLKDFQHAIEDYDAGLILEPYDAWLWFSRGHALHDMDDLREAAQSFKNATKFRPDTRYYLELAKTQLELKLYDDAIKTCDEAIKKSGHLASIYIERGKIYIKSGDDQRAIADFLKVIDLAQAEKNLSQELVADFYLGWLYQVRFKDYDKALAYYQLVLEVKPKDTSARINRSSIYMKLADYDAALTDVNIVLTQENTSEALNHKGFILTQKGDFEQASECYAQTIAAHPQDALAYCNLGALHFRKNQLTEALENAEKAYALEAAQPDILAYLTIIHHELGNAEKTADLWQTLLKLDSNYNNLEWIKTEKSWFDFMLPYAEKLIANLNMIPN